MSALRLIIIPVTPLQQNCALIFDETSKMGAVIDPGGDLEIVEEKIAHHGVHVEKILLTHGHMDHAGGAAELAERLGIPIEGPNIRDKFLLDRLQEAGIAYGMLAARSVTPDRWLQEGDSVTIADQVFNVHEAPGHTPGSVIFYNADNQLVIVGDVLFHGSVGRSDLEGGNGQQLLDSIKRTLLVLDDSVRFYSGHGPTGTIGVERRTNPHLQKYKCP